MNREEFMKKLEYLLQDIPDQEREDALAYYRDYLAEAGEEHEADAIRKFGSPERVAAIIRADLNGSLEDGGAFTDTGYDDERFRDPGYEVAKRRDLPDVMEENTGAEAGRDAAGGMAGGSSAEPGHRSAQEREPFRRVIHVVALLALLCIAAPIVLGIGGKAFGIAAGLITAAIGVVILIGILTVMAWVGAVVVLILGLGILFVHPGSGVLMTGCGLVLLGLGFLGAAVSVLVYGRLIPGCIAGVVNGISNLIHRGRRRSS